MPARFLLLVLALWAALAGTAWADEAAPTETPGMTAQEMEAWIEESPAAVWAMGILKFGGAAMGLVLLVLLWIRRDRIRAGLLPPPARVTALAPFTLSTTLAILGSALIALVLAQTLIADLQLGAGTKNAANMFVTQALLLGAALFVIVRRQRLGAVPKRGAAGITRLGVAAFFVACAVVIPVSLLNVLILQGIDQPISVYKPVEEIIRGGGSSSAWVITALAAVLAPVAEESLFRGMLYPALRSSLPRLKYAAVLAAVITSALFALMHPHPPSWLPLFALAMVLTWVFERTNSLGAVIGAHALWNITTLAPLLIRGAA